MVTKLQMLYNLSDYLKHDNSQWRYGQSLFSALNILDPETADKIRATKNDCFYQDNRVPVFIIKVNELWNE
jgi:hypothetical protein